jgi:transcriptional regulator GlxA family with amidase domain
LKIIEIVVLESSMLSSVAVTLDILEAANRIRVAEGRPAPFLTRIVGSGATRFASSDSQVSGDTPADVVIVPGLSLFNAKEIDAGLGRTDARRAQDHLRQAHADGREIAASCSGVFLLGSAGLLERRRVTTAWWLTPHFAKLFPNAIVDKDSMVVADGEIFTAGAAMAQIDLVLTLIARHAGPTIADVCSRYMLMDVRQSQASFVSAEFLTAGDNRLRKARDWVLTRLEDRITIHEIASVAGMSPRTFARRLAENTGLSPVKFVQRVRAERALALLETTRLPIDDIARRVGYADASTLRRVMQQHLGNRPQAIRSSARAARERRL